MTTNAQAALQAAATVFAESKQYASPDTITGMAYKFKLWLDRKDTEDAAKAEPAEEKVSHHISCSSRIRVSRFACDCQPVPYEEVKHWPTGLPMSPGGVIPNRVEYENQLRIVPKLPSSEGHPDNVPKPGPGPRKPWNLPDHL